MQPNITHCHASTLALALVLLLLSFHYALGVKKTPMTPDPKDVRVLTVAGRISYDPPMKEKKGNLTELRVFVVDSDGESRVSLMNDMGRVKVLPTRYRIRAQYLVTEDLKTFSIHAALYAFSRNEELRPRLDPCDWVTKQKFYYGREESEGQLDIVLTKVDLDRCPQPDDTEGVCVAA